MVKKEHAIFLYCYGSWYLSWFLHYVLVHTFFQPSILSSCFQFLSQVIKALLISTGHAITDRFCSLACSHLSALNGGRLKFTLYSSFLISYIILTDNVLELKYVRKACFCSLKKLPIDIGQHILLFDFFGASSLVQSKLMFFQFGGISRGRMTYYMEEANAEVLTQGSC